ncbi:MAG TPA: sialate O-acetylesterase [Beutenbergiaceae bacterium]|nr:sialate O-acetylesterase [Beutenbergiaceae bacterium]
MIPQSNHPAVPPQRSSPTRRSVLAIAAGASLAAASWPGRPAHATTPPVIEDIYLLIGQSNMAGRGPIEDQDKAELPGVYLFDSDERWTPSSNEPMGINRYSTVEEPGPNTLLSLGYTFGRHLQESTGRTLGLVVNPKGGTRMSEWRKEDPTGSFPLYAEAVRRARQALRRSPSAQLRGIIWHQGEGDNNEDSAERYLPMLSQMVADLRGDLRSPGAVFVAGEVGTWQGRGAHINPQIRKVGEHIDLATWVSSEGLTTHETDSDPWGPHFDSASQRTFGVRYADAVLDLAPLPA